MTLRVLAILVTLLAGCATPPPTPSLTVATARPTLDDPVLREVFELLDALPVRADVLELHAALASQLAERGDAAQAARVITQARGRLERAELSDPAPLHAILDRGARDAHRAALVHGLSRAACGPWAASEPCRATLNAASSAAALARLIPPAPTDQALLSERKRCMLHRDLRCAVEATLKLRDPDERSLALIELRRAHGAAHPALSADALGAALAAMSPARRGAARLALLDALIAEDAYAEARPLLNEAIRALDVPAAPRLLAAVARSLLDHREAALALPVAAALEAARTPDGVALRLEAQTLLEPTRATLNALLADAPIAAQRRLLLLFAEEAARRDLGLARLALSFARDADHALELPEARARVNIAATAQQAGQPYDDLLDPVFETSPEDTPDGAALYVQHAAATSKLRGGPQRLARARALISPAWDVTQRAPLYAQLIRAQEALGADADALDTFKQLLLALPSRAVSSQADAARVYDAEEVGHALRALLDARLLHHIPTLLALPLRAHERAQLIAQLAAALRPPDRSPQLIAGLRALAAAAPDEEARLTALVVLAPWLLDDPAILGELSQTPVPGALSKRARLMAGLLALELTARAGAEATISWVWRIEDLPTRQSILMDLISHLTQTSRPVAPSTIAQLRDVVSRGAGSSDELRRRLAALQVKAGDCRAAYTTLNATRVALSAYDLDGILWPCARSGADHIVLGLARLIEDEPTRARALLTLAALPRR
jgi:hypothetical protein